MILSVAITARAFLPPHWARWHARWGAPPPTTLSQWTCVRSSAFLVRALRRYGIDAVIRSGQRPETGGEDCGLTTADGWQGHAWVEANGFLIDITADQFGHAPVLFCGDGNPAYRPARDAASTLRVTAAGRAAIAEIWPAWCCYADRWLTPFGNCVAG